MRDWVFCLEDGMARESGALHVSICRLVAEHRMPPIRLNGSSA
jgi:hypothetical protein